MIKKLVRPNSGALEGGNSSPTKPKKRTNDLDGRDWTKYSLSVWNDIRWSKQEQQLEHPAMFPTMLVERLIRCFTRNDELRILDPFMGSGSTMIAARNLRRQGVGFELYLSFIDLARERLRQDGLFTTDLPAPEIHHEDARKITSVLSPESIDFCVTSPPYWDILLQKRTADSKEIRNYGKGEADLGTLADYAQFLDALQEAFAAVYAVLKPHKYCAVNVMDLRKKNRFYPFHSDLSRRMETVGFVLDDIFIWDRRQEYNNLRCLGYPYVFRINKIHEYILIFQKP